MCMFCPNENDTVGLTQRKATENLDEKFFEIILGNLFNEFEIRR